MDACESFYLINESPTSSTSTLVLQIPAIPTGLYTGEDLSLTSGQESSLYFVPTAASSPYMRSPGRSSPEALAFQDYPPQSSSPPMSYCCSSPYFVAAALTGSGLSSTSSAQSSGSRQDFSDTRWCREWEGSRALRKDKDAKSEDRFVMDVFARQLYERLLVVARERDNTPSTGHSDFCTGPTDERSYFSSRALSMAPDSSASDKGTKTATVLASTGLDTQIRISPVYTLYDDTSYEKCAMDDEESHLDTPIFALPPASENITPPKHHKRTRERNPHHDTVPNTAFESLSPVRNVSEETMPSECPLRYRLIWRAESYQAIRTQRLVQEEWEKDAPPLKRQKAVSYTHFQQFASKPASIRRAASLKSVYGLTTRSESVDVDQHMVPTTPATPIPNTSPNSRSERSFFMYGVPIIAPPPDHVAGLPISEETLAKIRLHRFIEREFSSMQADGLGVPGVYCQEGHLGCAKRDHDQILGLEQKYLWEEFLAIGQVLREEVVDWLLNVMPGLNQSTPGSSFYSTTSYNSSSSGGADLYDELFNSPETRFHAVYILLRFFNRAVSCESRIQPVGLGKGITHLRRTGDKFSANSQGSIEQEGRWLMIWDVAIGSLALSIKFHRDFLEPFSPIFAREYLTLAPHRLSFGDLESAQRDILMALSYSFGVTPQPLLDNLWTALPALRELLQYEGGWNCALKETWLQLFDAVSEPDVLRFPLSLLTVACMVEGILAALIYKHDYMLKWRKSVFQTKRKSKEGSCAKKQRVVRRIEEDAEGVIHDIQAVLEISDVQLKECRLWLAGIHGHGN